MRLGRVVVKTGDLTAAGAVAVSTVVSELLKGRLRRRRRHPGLRLLTLEGDYSLETIRRLGLWQIVTSRDLEGFFEHVWTVNPLVGAAPDDRGRTPPGPPSVSEVASRHTMIEGRIERSERLRTWPTLNVALAQRQLLAHLGTVIRQEGVSVVRASDPFYLGLLGILLARANGLPLVIHLIANYDGQVVTSALYPRLFRSRALEKRIERFLLPRCQLVAAGTVDIQDYAIRNGAAADRATVFRVGNLIDDAHFGWEPQERPSVRAELGLDDGPVVICVCRLEPVKHPEDVVRVIADPRLQRLGVRAVLVGEGSMRAALEAEAAELGVVDRVLFVGNRDQKWLAQALSSANVVLSPLTGRALIEAMLSSTPTVAYDVDWHAELVHDGETGLLAPYRDTEKMAGAVFDLLTEPDRAAALGAAGRAYALKTMDPEVLLHHERSAYTELLGSPPAHPAAVAPGNP